MGWRLELMSISCANVRVMPGTNQYSCSNTKWSSPQHHNKLTWWLGKIRVSAITTFSRRPAANTITSAISSGVSGSQFLHNNPSALPFQHSHFKKVLRIYGISLLLISVESHNGEFLTVVELASIVAQG